MIHTVQKLIALVIVTTIFTVSSSSNAFAHVVVSPKQVETAAFQTFTVSVPNEKDTATTSLKLNMPNGLRYVTPTSKAGWTITTDKNSDNTNVQTITWSGGSIAAGFRDEFTFSAQVSAEPTNLTWKAYLTYADGTVVSWDASETDNDENEGPASITKVMANANQPESSDETVADTNSSANRAIIISTTAVIISFIAIFINTRKR
jgi:uncharacterized protein YcnI